MSKIGVIFTSFNHAEYLHDALTPWIQARGDKLNGHEFVIAAVSVPFKEYECMEIIPDNTTELLREYFNTFQIDHLIDEPKFISEADARNRALQLLLRDNVDLIILWDGDEIFDIQQLSNILDYVTLNKWISWFSISYKNYVFDASTYLEVPFTPPRIFRVATNGYKVKEIYHDNDCLYTGQVTGLGELKIVDVSYKQLPTKVIPASVAFVRHLSWISNEKSKNKVAYQVKRGWECSFAWDERKGLIFNAAFFQKRGLTLPKTISE